MNKRQLLVSTVLIALAMTVVFSSLSTRAVADLMGAMRFACGIGILWLYGPYAIKAITNGGLTSPKRFGLGLAILGFAMVMNSTWHAIGRTFGFSTLTSDSKFSSVIIAFICIGAMLVITAPEGSADLPREKFQRVAWVVLAGIALGVAVQAIAKFVEF